MKHFNFKSLIVLFLVLIGISSNAWAYWYIPGTFPGTSWTSKSGKMNSSNEITFYACKGDYEFQLQDENGGWSGNSCIKETEGPITKSTNGSNAKISINDSKTCDIKIQVVDETNWKVKVTATESPYYIKYSWNGAENWTWSSAMTSEGDGKYSCIGQYGNTSAYNYNRKTNDDGQGYRIDANVVGLPSKGDQCVFTFNSSDNSLTIRKCSYVDKTSHVYFDNSNANWNDSYIQFIIGRPVATTDEYSGQYRFNSITNTKLLYVAVADIWSDVAYYAVMGTSSAYSGTKWYIPNVYNADHYSAAYTNKYDLQKDMVTLVKKDNATNKGAISLNYISGGYSDLNKPQTIKVMVKKAGESGYSEETTFANWPGSIKAKRYKLNSNGASSATETNQDITSTATFTSVITSEATLTATAGAGYVCRGWGDASNSTPSGNATKTYTVSDATTSYVFFEEQTYTVNFGVHSTNHGGIEVTAAGEQIQTGANVKASVEVVFTATPDDGYHVVGWYSDAGCTQTISGAGTGTSYTINSLNAAANVYVKFAPNTYTVKFHGNGNTSGTMRNQSFTYDEAAKPLTTNAFAKTGYTFLGWDTDQSADAVVYEDKKEVFNLTKTNGGVFNLYAVWQEKIYSGITVVSNNTDKGTVNVSTATFGYTTGQQIIASHKAGYYLKDWTLPANAKITTTSSTATTTTITVKATGDEAVSGTITANFAERWVLRGGRSDGSGDEGMPGWETNTDIFTFAAGETSSTKTVTLLPNRDYKYMIYDKKGSIEHGQANEGNYQTDGSTWTLNGTYEVLFKATGYGTYTFKLTEYTGNVYPQIWLAKPLSYQITMAPKAFTNNQASSDPSNGGTLTAKTTENATDFVVSDGKYVRDGGSVVFTATPKTGYSFAGFYSNAECTSELQAASIGTTYTISNIQENKAVYAKFTENLTTVVIDWDGDGKVQVKDGSGNWTDATKGTTTVQAGVYTHPSVKAVVTDGSSHYFAKWTWNANADFEAEHWEEDYAETTVIGKGQGLTSGQTLTANFLELDKIYFNNNAEGVYHWPTGNSIHVFFDVKWDNDTKKGVVPAGCQHLTMQQIGSTNIWWTYIPRYVYDHYWGTLAFADADMSGNDYFHGNHAVYRTDYKKEYNMYVPKASTSYNTTDYFSDGYWMRYEGYTPGDNMGYELYKNSSATNIGQFIATSANEGQIKYRIDQTGDIEFCVKTNSVTGYGQATEFTTTTTKQDLPRYNDNYKFTVKVDAEGDYTFTLKLGEGKDMYLEIGYPVGEGDYRVAWTDGSSNEHYSDVVKSNEATETHTLSMYLKPNEGSLKLQKCTDITDGVPQWSEGTAINWTDFTKGQGVYQFDITITADNAALTNVDLYTGNYYIKTDGVKGGWGNYKENIMDENTSTFSTADATTYDRYYCQWISNEGKKYNVKCVIANDYCNALSDTLRGDDYTEMSGTEPLLPQPANVRFSYNTYTNTLSRAYISGSSKDADRFLMLIGDEKMFNDKGQALINNELKFTDKNNWVYQADIQAQPGCAVKLTANYDGKVQYFIGGENETKTIISGGASDKQYTMRAVYDFKTNRLIVGWIPPEENIGEDIILGGDMLISRTHQEDAQQITFGDNGSIEDIHHVYGVLTLTKTEMTDAATMSTDPTTGKYYENNMYWISFPFEVKISEIFGVAGYGTNWVIQRYDGVERAQKGWTKETPTFWKYMGTNEVMNAYEGYVLCLDPDAFYPTNASVWDNSATEANFYFPSASGEIGIVQADNLPQSVSDEYHICYIDRNFKPEGMDTEMNHTITDSHWNVIGVPAFQDANAATVPTSSDFKAFYEWNPKTNGYVVKTIAGTTDGEYHFKTMHAYMTQFYGTINWTNVSIISKEIAAAPYRYADNKNYMIELFFNGNGAEDHTYIKLADEASTDFVLNEDMMKIDNAGYPNIYSFAGSYNVAYNETKMDNQMVTLGVSAPKAGTYTFSMPKEFSGTAKLIDLVEGTTTDLNVSNYSVDLNKGTYNSRFQLLLEVEAKAPTSIQEDGQKGREADGKTTKLLRNGNIYLINAGRVYNATGAELGK